MEDLSADRAACSRCADDCHVAWRQKTLHRGPERHRFTKIVSMERGTREISGELPALETFAWRRHCGKTALAQDLCHTSVVGKDEGLECLDATCARVRCEIGQE